jgi:hypothetical protein
MFGLGTLAQVVGEVRRDVAAAHARDPAARGVSSVEILTSWPGVQAVLAHRVAHGLHAIGVPVMPRTLSILSRAWTGVEIHPAAQIGKGFFIDHAAGVVIGETAEIGDDVTLYQGVTLGGVATFSDLDKATIFADNLVPHVLRCDGVLRYGERLAAHIDSGLLLPAGREEREIRACAVHACELIAQRVGTTEHELDNWLWSRGQAPEYKARPRHRTRTVYY